MKIGIIGAGPAGMMAALEARKFGGQTLLFDGNPSVGRKLLVTGSGRCNLTNAAVAADRYHCADHTWIAAVLDAFGHDDLLNYLHGLGILTYATSDGWVYPRSESAAAVVAIINAALEQAGVEVHSGTRIRSIERHNRGFILIGDTDETFELDRVVVACGGMAFPSLGSTGHLFPVLKALGHTIIPVRPALAPILAEMGPYRKLQGVRLDAKASLFEKDNLLGSATGNLIFTEWGLNGPAVMDISHLVSARPGVDLRLELNLLFDCEAELRGILGKRQGEPVLLRTLLGSALPPKVPPLVLELAGLPGNVTLKDTSHEKLETVFHLLTHLPFNARGVRGFEYCQVSSGGIAVDEVDARSMQSKIVPGLFFVGEVLDVTGPCGGYNLQFAFSTGVIAGRAAGKA